MHTKVKICGITKIEEVEFINSMDVDFIGFVFAKSKRQVNINQAASLSNALRNNIKKVGVFVAHSVDEINEYIKKADLDIIQLHKNYTEEMISKINKPVWYAISIKDETSIEEAAAASKYNNLAAVVTDTYVAGADGGTGKTFNWQLLDNLKTDIPLVLAGGLNADNIESAVITVHPDIIDISSGAEISIGGTTMKSKEKIEDILRKAKK